LKGGSSEALGDPDVGCGDARVCSEPGVSLAICFATADRVTDGEAVDEAAKKADHEACQRALAETSSIVQKYQLQEADFDLVGRPPKQ